MKVRFHNPHPHKIIQNKGKYFWSFTMFKDIETETHLRTPFRRGHELTHIKSTDETRVINTFKQATRKRKQKRKTTGTI